MWRYYAAATAIVVLIGSIAFAHRLVTGGWTTRPDTTQTRRANPGNANAGYAVTPPPYFTGQGDWVMSALPECFAQQSSIEGPSALLASHVPPASSRIAPGTTLHRGDCTVRVRASDLWVRRGRDSVRVPPEARLYDTPPFLTLVDRHNGRTIVRVYSSGSGAEAR